MATPTSGAVPVVRSELRTRTALVLESIALRHQIAVLERGRFANEAFAALIVCHVAENKADEAIGIDGARWFMHHVGQLFTPLMAKNQIYSYEYTRTLFGTGIDPGDMNDADLKQHPMVVVGNPDEVIRKLEEIQSAGIDQAICFKQAGRIPHPNIMRSFELMGRHVLPHFSPKKAAAVS
jgi:alkanesulfonate monooxygenase SsuD/methylene tetrahydromethanopterin reductase-like flavin-dependent oxidoreductase (luciferase family)